MQIYTYIHKQTEKKVIHKYKYKYKYANTTTYLSLGRSLLESGRLLGRSLKTTKMCKNIKILRETN